MSSCQKHDLSKYLKKPPPLALYTAAIKAVGDKADARPRWNWKAAVSCFGSEIEITERASLTSMNYLELHFPCFIEEQWAPPPPQASRMKCRAGMAAFPVLDRGPMGPPVSLRPIYVHM
ncbi:hypothetical protein OIU85_025719 [Salix viminalis]|uniref:Uncharacterized protein n=1 Tax=Salix viminalis TaxID=40686 RepID=A0A9Q0TLY9_SALVM|nr:hypothetical protein OIU85_025719 [Salix viminalis]